MTRFEKNVEFLEKYRSLCEEFKVYVGTTGGRQVYVMSILYPVDEMFEDTMKQLKEDIGA